MSTPDVSAEELERPIKRTDGDTLEERLTSNAYDNILPARYLRKDGEGNVAEQQEELFERVAKNVALAEAVYEAERRDTEVTVSPDQVKPDHPRRDELAAEVFGAGTTTDDDAETTLTETNVNKFAYDTVVSTLPGEIAQHVQETAADFREKMERLAFMPNCVPPESLVAANGGLTPLTDVDPGERVYDDEGGDAHVDSKYENGEKEVWEIETESGYTVRATPEHYFRVITDRGEYEWRQVKQMRPDDVIALQKNFLDDEDSPVSLCSTTATDGGTIAEETNAVGRPRETIRRPETMTPDLAEWLGLYVGDGTARESGVRVAFDEQDTDLVDYWCELTNSVFGFEPTTRTRHDAACEIGQASRHDLYEFLEQNDLLKETSKTATVPEPVLASGRTCAERFLAGLFEADGTVGERSIELYTHSEPLADQVQKLLLGLGIRSSVTEKRDGYRVTVRKNVCGKRFVERVGFRSKRKREAAKRYETVAENATSVKIPNQTDRLNDWYQDSELGHDAYQDLSQFLIDPESEYSQEIGKEIFRSYAEEYPELWDSPVAEFVERDQFYETVSTIEAVGTMAVEDMQVPRRNTYVVEGFVSHNSPTLMNAGDELQQLSACFVDSPADDIDDIHQTAKEAAQVFQSGGGMGYAFWKLRPYGDAVGSTGGIASGPITFMRTFDQMCETIAQGGARRGAQMGVMRVSHPDVIQFIHAKNKDVSLARSLRLNDPDDFTHTSFADALEEARELIDDDGKVPEHLRNAVEGHLSNFNISVGITDDFMEAVKNDEPYTFTNPRTEEPHVATYETKELYEMFGLGDHVEVGETLSVPAREIWNHIVEGAHENGEPGIVYLERINEMHSFDVDENPDHRILATNPCVTGDTLISTENGLVTAEELYEQGTATDVVVDGRLSEETVKEASSVYATGEKDVFELTTEEGYELRLTADHRVMTEDGWVEAGELDAGDTVHIQNRKGAFGQHGSAEEGRVLGWLVGDGHMKHGEERAVLNFYDEDAEVSESFADDVNAVVREPTGNADYGVGVSEISRDDDHRGAQAVEQRIRSTRLYEYAAQAGLADEKLQVPDAVMRGSEEMARGFLQALFTADGSVQGNVEKGVSVRLASTDRDLLSETQQLLLNFGIKSKIYEDQKEAGTTELPDGDGGTKEYETQGFHELAVVKKDLVRFREEIGFLLDYKNEALDERLDSYDRGPYSTRFEATVESVEHDGHETVYDLTEPETNSFVANGLVVHNCGEQPLEEYEACNLGHINLSTLAAQDAPDWRVWSEEHEFDSLEDGVERFLQEAVDFEEFDDRIETGTRFLENVVTMSDFPVDEIEETVAAMRKIGIGIMGLAQLYIQLGVKYGDEVANEIAEQLMVHINHESKTASHELAEQRGVFDEWDNSKYADPTEYREWFEHHTGEDADEWADGYPVRNHNTTTIAPTGCVEENSLVSTDDGLRPIKDLDETTAEFEQWDEIDVGVTTDGGTKAATAVYDNGFADVRQIETEGGFSVAATPNHRFRTLTENGEYAWKEADDFESGDRILLQRNTFDGGSRLSLDTSEREDYYRNTDDNLELPDQMTPELAEFLGYFMGDGYVHDGVGVKLVVESEATELDDHLRELGQRLFGVTPTVEDRETRHMLTFGGRHLPRYFEDNGWKKDDGNHGEGAASAFVPEEVLRGDEPVVKAFLRGLFEADGTASRKIELSTVSDTLADQVQTLLLSLGCVFVRDTLEMEDVDDHYGDRPRHSVRGANKREDQRFLDEIGFVTKSTEFELNSQSYRNDTYPPSVVDHLRAVDGYDSVSKPVRKRVNQSPINGAVSRRLVRDVEAETGETVRIDGRELTDFYAATVESVTEGTAYTKDISVPSNNTYVADGFVTHNTTSMVGNTTGGCEPIYNVAYYKNVSDDVQGDEMLVEFDDYFLRTLEKNDLDVEAVKREAQEQMATNEFDGVDGLETVPDAIGELFVVTGDLNAKDHAGVQVACQKGVDSAISKCLEAGTLVQTDSGVRPIESFADETPEAGEFTEVEEDVTVDGVAVESQYYAGEKDATRVRVDNGSELVGATDSHKVLTPDGWTVLGDLEEGDYVIGRHTESHGDGNTEISFSRRGSAVADGGATVAASGVDPSVYEKEVTLPSKMSPTLARFLGMYAADGSAIDERYTVEISTSSERVREEARDLFEELFGREPSVEADTRGGESRDTVYGVRLNSKPVWEFVTTLCGSGSYEKDVPRSVLRGSPEEKLAFVNGVTLDGYVSSQSLVVYGGMSRDLADGVASLVRSFGVPKVYVGRKWVAESEAYAYQVHLTNEAQELVTPIEPHKQASRFDQRYRVYVPEGRVDKTNYDSRSQAYYAARSVESREQNYMFDTTAEKLGIDDAPPLHEVTEVEDAGTREMYDIELAGPHEYVVGGVVSHNTVNAPNDSTVEDAREVFEYIYDHGGKGVTYYRDGTRSKQVLTTRADNTEFADESEAAETIVEQISEVFGGVEAFLDNEDVQAAVDTEIDELLAASERPQVNYTEKRPRPDSLTGVTQLIETGYGKIYVTINEDPQTGEPFELFANIGHSGGFTNSFTESLAKVISTALRSGVDPAEIVDELQGTRSPKVAWDKGEQIQSIPDAIGTAMRRYLDGEIDRAHPEQQNLGEIDDESASGRASSASGTATDAPAEPTPESDGGVAAEEATDDVAELIANGESPECPDCGSMTLYYSEGCKTCESCGWSEC